MRGPLTRSQLDSMPCHCCGVVGHKPDEPMVLKARCHPGRGLRVEYSEGVIKVSCAACQQFVADVEVAP